MNKPENDTEQVNENEKRIALWPGRNRESGSQQPWLTGRFTLDGKLYFVTLWKRERESDRQPILSGQITEDEPLGV